MKRLRRASLWLAAALVLVAAGCPSTAEIGTSKGDVAPDFSLPNLGGGSQSLRDLRGSTVILTFWASWCAPCRAEMPDMQVAYGELRDRGLVVVGVNEGETLERVEAFVQEFGLTFPIVLDEKQGTARTYGVRAYPTTLVIDGEGVIQEVVVGGPLTRSAILRLVEGKLK